MKIWSGFLYMPAFQANKVIKYFYDTINMMSIEDDKTCFDSCAAGPLACFSYISQIGVQVISVHLVHTKPPKDENAWPSCWSKSPFKSLWRFWSTCSIRTLTSATDEMNALNPPGRRQVFATTTIENDRDTLSATHAAYNEAITSLRCAKVKGLVWTLVLQPLLSKWAQKGDANPLGLDASGSPVIVSFTVNWDEKQHDDLVKTTTRHTVEQIDAVATANNTNHPYRYLNYCADWQRPFEGYGEGNLRFLQAVSREYDPDGLFQNACVGGFKLCITDAKT